MDYEALYEDLVKVLEDLMEKNRDAPILVEGERDVRALRSLGFHGDVRALNRGGTIFGLCEALARERRGAIILTDWDAKGGRLARQLREALAANAVRYDDELRGRLAVLCRKDIKDVESLGAFVGRIEEILETRNRSKPSKRWYPNRRSSWRRYRGPSLEETHRSQD